MQFFFFFLLYFSFKQHTNIFIYIYPFTLSVEIIWLKFRWVCCRHVINTIYTIYTHTNTNTLQENVNLWYRLLSTKMCCSWMHLITWTHSFHSFFSHTLTLTQKLITVPFFGWIYSFIFCNFILCWRNIFHSLCFIFRLFFFKLFSFCFCNAFNLRVYFNMEHNKNFVHKFCLCDVHS